MNCLNIENHAVANTPDAPWNQEDMDEGVEECAICGREGLYYDSRWLADFYMDTEEGVSFWNGKDMVDAEETPKGWVCSHDCLSEIVYRSATEIEKEALDSVLDACRVIASRWQIASTAISRVSGTPDIGDDIIKYADAFLDALGQVSDRNGWTERERKEALLEEELYWARARVEELEKARDQAA